MCAPKAPKPVGPSAPPPPPQPVADRIADPKRDKNPLDGAKSGRSSLVIQRSVGGLDQSGSGLVIGR